MGINANGASRRELFKSYFTFALGSFSLSGEASSRQLSEKKSILKNEHFGTLNPSSIQIAPARTLADMVNDNPITSNYASTQAAIDAQSFGGIVTIAQGEASSARIGRRDIGLRGKGISSIIRPATANSVALEADYRQGSWEYVAYKDFALEGVGSQQGSGFRSGPQDYGVGAEYSGRSILSNIKISNFNKAIDRPFGNIGLELNSVSLGTGGGNNYGIWGTGNLTGSGDIMHGGNMIMRGGHIERSEKAAVYIKSPVTGTGQVVFDSVIMEANPGWCFFIDAFNAIGGQPGLAIKHCWNETNYTGGLVAVEGKTLTAGWGYFNSTTIIGVEDTPIGPTTLIKSNMVTDRCDLSHLSDLSMDANSALSHSRARIFSGTALGLVNSITGAHNATGLTSPFYPMPLPKGFAAGYNVVNTNNAQSILKFVGSTNRATTPILAPGIGGLAKVQSLTINGGDILQSSSFVVPADKYLVFTLVAGLISGAAPTVRLSGSRSIGGALTVRDKEMRAITGIMKSGMASLPGVRLYIKGGTFSSIIHIGGWHVTAFDSANEAVSFANAAIWPLSESETYTLINMTEKRRLDTNAGTGPVSPSYVQSELQETRDALATTQDVLATLIEDIRNGCILS